MAVYRQTPVCFKCGDPYKAINKSNDGSFIGDDFISWDYGSHVCDPDKLDEFLKSLNGSINKNDLIDIIVSVNK